MGNRKGRTWLINGFSPLHNEKISILIEPPYIADVVIGKPIELSQINDIDVIDVEGMYVVPGGIDAHVHFREPGMEHKGDFFTESMGAIRGGITTVFDMPNNIPFTSTLRLLSKKIEKVSGKAWTNFSFYLGAHPHYLHEILKIDVEKVCGVKVYTVETTGINTYLISGDIERILLFCGEVGVPVVFHSEDASVIAQNMKYLNEKENIPRMHAMIRNRDACISSTKKIIDIAKKYKAHVHIAHISTIEEVEMIYEAKKEGIPISGEVALPHLIFSDKDYETKEGLIKVNPSIKGEGDRVALWDALTSGILDIVVTDHAPHLPNEKQGRYSDVSSGVPSVEFFLPLLFTFAKKEGKDIKSVLEKASCSVASLFRVFRRGKIEKGFFADIVVIRECKKKISEIPVISKCGWTPFYNFELNFETIFVWVNGEMVLDKGVIVGLPCGSYVSFERSLQ